MLNDEQILRLELRNLDKIKGNFGENPDPTKEKYERYLTEKIYSLLKKGEKSTKKILDLQYGVLIN